MAEADRAQFDDLVTRYVDRLAAGEKIDPENLLLDHPDWGPWILEELRVYLDLDEEEGWCETPVKALDGGETLRQSFLDDVFWRKSSPQGTSHAGRRQSLEARSVQDCQLAEGVGVAFSCSPDQTLDRTLGRHHLDHVIGAMP